MSVHQHSQERSLNEIPTLRQHRKQHRDSSGYPVFSTGEDGDVHVVVHRMLDSDRNDLGQRLLGKWLDGRTGSGSNWVHLQWHMAVFDLSLGHWNAALARFREQILPAVTNSCDALTDAPALLWRLSLAADTTVALPWEPVRLRALASMNQPRTTFVEMHNLLALAGAGDLGNLERWLQNRTTSSRSRIEAIINRVASALRSFVLGNYAIAAAAFESIMPHVAEFGGSRVQNMLFRQIQESAYRRASTSDSLTPHLKVA